MNQHLLGGALLLALGVVVTGCQDRPVCPVDPKLTAYVHERLGASVIDKVDVVLTVDNSVSMADKQAILALAVPDLVQGLVNPPCLDPKGQPVTPGPQGPLDVCPKGSARPFEPVLDIHVGVLSTSLGSRGADQCLPTPDNPTNDDRAHLLTRGDPTGSIHVPTYEELGFLAWDPAQELTPPGESDLDADTDKDPNNQALLPVLAELVTAAGQNGCGFESQLESWYRFLVDPSPYDKLSLDDSGRIKLEGIDQQLLEQRKRFLRPDSLLAIILLTDEDDCSLREVGTNYLAFQRDEPTTGSDYHLPAPRSECAADPNDPCCFSCSQQGPKDDAGNPMCPPDPACEGENGDVRRLTNFEDPLTLRCWDQKRRFGVDLLHPLERYKDGLSSPTVVDRNGQSTPNPLFTDLDPTDDNSNLRDPSMVILTGIVGVPWQDLARDPKDLTKGFRSAEELAEKDASGKTRWDVIVGDPTKNIPPEDPLMIQDREPRKGTNPITLDPMADSSTPLLNPINGHDFKWNDQLEYACVFPLLSPLPCDGFPNCIDPGDSPVFDPPYAGLPKQQPRAGGVPATRILRLLQSIGAQGVAASVCPAQTTDKTALDFGYRPAVAAALSRLQLTLSRTCLPRALQADASGQVNCTVIEASHKPSNGACCDPAEARLDVPENRQSAVEGILADELVQGLGYDCFCEIPQLQGTSEGEPLWACQNDPARAPELANGDKVNGYCYVDQTSDPPVGNPALVASCPDTEKRNIRFVGKGNPTSDATIFITCGVADDTAAPGCDAQAH